MSKTLKPVLILAAILICGFAACNSNDLTTSSTPKSPASSGPPRTALPMPPVSGRSLEYLGWTVDGGKRSVLHEYKGQVLVLDFYATWCEPCRRSIPHLIGLQNKYADQGLQVIGLNVGGPNDLEKVPAFAKEFGIQYTLAVPEDELVSFLLGNNDAIPQTFIFDRQLMLAERLIGFGPNAADRMDSAVEAALKSPAP
jgi:thiol-disulfide isomerase/thioredoxin